jgi:hypothetical protein
MKSTKTRKKVKEQQSEAASSEEEDTGVDQKPEVKKSTKKRKKVKEQQSEAASSEEEDADVDRKPEAKKSTKKRKKVKETPDNLHGGQMRAIEKSTAGKVKNSLRLVCKTKIENKSDQSIKLIISYQPMTVTVRSKVEAGVSVPFPWVEATATLGREHEIQKGEHPHQEAVLLPNSREPFELPWRNYYLIIFTERMDGACVIHENRLVRSSQDWVFEQSDLKKQVEIKWPPIPTPSPAKKWWNP